MYKQVKCQNRLTKLPILHAGDRGEENRKEAGKWTQTQLSLHYKDYPLLPVVQSTGELAKAIWCSQTSVSFQEYKNIIVYNNNCVQYSTNINNKKYLYHIIHHILRVYENFI